MTPRDLFQWAIAVSFAIVAIGIAVTIARNIWRDGL